MSNFSNLIKQKRTLLMSRCSPNDEEVMKEIEDINAKLSGFTIEPCKTKKDPDRKLKFSKAQIDKYEIYLQNIQARSDPNEMYSKKRDREKEIARVEKILQKHKSRLNK